MENKFSFDLQKIRAEGFVVSIHHRVTTGRLLIVRGLRQCADALSDLPTLAEYSEIVLSDGKSGVSLFIATAKLLTNPQVIVGFQNGIPVLLGVRRALEANCMVAGQTRSGKSTTLALMAYQLNRLGFPVGVIGLKSFDPSLVAALKAGTDSLTRLDAEGRRTRAPFEYTTLQPGTKTKSYNYHTQSMGTPPAWLRASSLLQSFGQGGGGATDPTRRFFQTSALTLLQSLPEWGESWDDLKTAMESQKQDRDAKYSTAGIRNDVAQLAAIDQLNRPATDPASIDLTSIFRARGAFYFDGAYQFVGPIATAASATVLQSAIAAKAQLNPSRDFRVFIFVDEAQQIPRDQLKQLVEQCASLGICLIFAFHTLEQLGEDWPTIAMVQTRLIFSAVPGSLLDRHLQNIFGTELQTVMTFNSSDSTSTSQSTSVSSGPAGTSYGTSFTSGKGQNSGFGLAEKRDFVWTIDDTLELNADKDRFVLQVSPGAELAHFGPRAIVVQRGGYYMSFEEVNQLTAQVLEATPNTYLPGATKQLGHNSELPVALQEKRTAWLAIFEKTANQLRQEFN